MHKIKHLFMTDASFGRRLRSERDRLAMTQDDFGALGGVRRLTQHLYEQDSRVPDLKYLMGVATAGVDLVYLMLGRREALGNPEHISMSAAQLTELYRLVDEFATDAKGRLLPLDARVKFFQMLVSSFGDAGAASTPDQLRERMARFARG